MLKCPKLLPTTLGVLLLSCYASITVAQSVAEAQAYLLSHNYCSGCNLAEVNLFRSDLSGKQLNNANLAGADLGRCNLKGTNFAGCQFKTRQISRRKFKRR